MHCSMLYQKKRGKKAKEGMDENARLNAFLINEGTRKIAHLKSVWLPCMYDCMIDCSWESGVTRREKKRKTRGRKTEVCM